MSDFYEGAGDGQCLAIKTSDGNRCTSGVSGSNLLCGTHVKASDVTLAHEVDDRDYYWCPECGFQPMAWDGDVELCGSCSIEFPPVMNESVYRLLTPDDDFKLEVYRHQDEWVNRARLVDETTARSDSDSERSGGGD